ncbi:alpha/beta hydrolase domain-containing protein 11 [Melia azedarach]|uniref:Alpha/beta hydrolase domain-containing protein 11 n=1 Tax=Melia azedarach TaxID=155640 RepID=A0ACC1X299_MELAZ|nr:alpha/beta hydrolase domain-containing protein 11 [Melia azedarach]
MANAADDLANLIKANSWDWPDAVFGHSMGGKVASHFARSCARAEYGQSVALPKQNLSFSEEFMCPACNHKPVYVILCFTSNLEC